MNIQQSTKPLTMPNTLCIILLSLGYLKTKNKTTLHRKSKCKVFKLREKSHNYHMQRKPQDESN